MKTPTPSTETTPTVDKLLYPPVEAAHALGVSRSTVYELIASGALASVQIGSCRCVSVEALRSYVRKLATEPGSGTQARPCANSRTFGAEVAVTPQPSSETDKTARQLLAAAQRIVRTSVRDSSRALGFVEQQQPYA